MSYYSKEKVLKLGNDLNSKVNYLFEVEVKRYAHNMWELELMYTYSENCWITINPRYNRHGSISIIGYHFNCKLDGKQFHRTLYCNNIEVALKSFLMILTDHTSKIREDCIKLNDYLSYDTIRGI